MTRVDTVTSPRNQVELAPDVSIEELGQEYDVDLSKIQVLSDEELTDWVMG